MGFDRGSGGGFPDLPARIENIGLDYVEFKNGAQHRIVVVYEPLEDKSPMGTQTNKLNTSNELVTGGDEQTIEAPGRDGSYNIDIVGDIVVNGTIGGKAKVWLDALEKLGYDMTNLERTGDLSVLVGLEVEWRQMTYSEVVKQEPDPEYPEKKFWMPIKLLKKPAVQKTIDQEINEVIDGKNEDKMMDFAKDKGMRVATVFQKIEQAIEKGDIRMVDNRYEVITK